jgi:uncharacterized protein YbaP (TraB family)
VTRRGARLGPLSLLVGLALLGGCAAKAPEATRATKAPASPGLAVTPLLWQAAGPGQAGASLFLLGSIHVGREAAVDFGDSVADAYARCDELVVEVDLSALSEEEIVRQTRPYLLLPDGQTLRGALSGETYQLLDAHLRARGTPMAAVERLRPWVVATMLAMFEFEAAGLWPQYGVDQRFIERADGRRSIRGLETLRSQLEVFDRLSPRLQDLMLADSLLNIEREIGELARAWEQGDEAALTELIFASLDEHPEFADFYEAIFFTRNEDMAAQLARLAGDGKRRFVVLGSGHMLGPRGIPALLAARGFRVERVVGR